jgi:DNA invertase Pin-like site-specific DNA recombinase
MGTRVTPRIIEQVIGRPLSRQDYAVSLARVSTDAEHQKSLPDQHSLNRRNARSLGLTVRHEYTDEMSRQLWPRPGVSDALKLVADEHCVAIFVWETERIWGSVRQQAEIYDMLEMTRTLLIDGHLSWGNSPDENDRFNAEMNAILAQREVRKVSTRVYEIFRERAKKGQITPKPAYGFRVRDGALEVDPDELRIVQMMFEWVVHDGLGVRAIQGRLADMGIRSRKGKPWDHSTIHRMLGNPLYRGEMVWGKWTTVHVNGSKIRVARPESEWIRTPSPLGAVIDEKLFLEANRLLVVRRNKRQHGKKEVNGLFDTVIRCHRCGSRMYPHLPAGILRSTGKRSTYINYACHYTSRCPRAHQMAERVILSHLESWLEGDEELRISFPKPQDFAERKETLEARLAELQEERKGYLRLAAKRLISDDECEATLRELEAQVQEVRSQQESLIEPVVPPAEVLRKQAALRKAWRLLKSPEIPIASRQAVIEKLFASIRIDHPNVLIELIPQSRNTRA